MNELIELVKAIGEDPELPDREWEQRHKPILYDGFHDTIAVASQLAGELFFIKPGVTNTENIEEFRKHFPREWFLILDTVEGMNSWIQTPKGRILFTCQK